MSSHEQKVNRVMPVDRLYEDDEPQTIKTRREALVLLDRVQEQDGEQWPRIPTAQEVAQIYAQLVPAERWAVCDTVRCFLNENPEPGKSVVAAIKPIIDGIDAGTQSYPMTMLETIDLLRKLPPDELRGVLSVIRWYYGAMIEPNSEE